MAHVSVLVPSYNHAKFVERTLRSIFAQTLPPKKLIVIDDGSKDESVAVIERILAESPIDSELIARENRGLSATLNDGYARLDGEFFAYLGSDDLWLPNFLAEQTLLLESRPAASLAFCHAYVIDEDDNIIDRTDNWTDFADGHMLPMLLQGEIPSSPGVLYRRSALLEKPWNENARLEDYELYLNLASRTELARNEKLLCAWRQHSSNTSDDSPLMLREQIAAQDRSLAAFGLNRAQLDQIQTALKFRSVANFVRSGHRREAFKLFRESFGAAPTFADVVGKAIRLAIPRSIFEWNRARKHRKNISRYGKLTL